MGMYEYSGIVVGRQKKQVYIRPQYKIQNGKVLQTLTLKELAALCLNGLVYWDQAPAYVYPDSWWSFDVSGEGLSKSATNIKPLVEVIGLSPLAEKRPDRLFKYLSNFTLSYTPSQCVYVPLKKGTWAGPIPLMRHPDYPNATDMWRYDVNALEARVPFYRLSQEHFISLKGAPTRQFLSPWYTPEQPVGYIRVADGVVVSAKQAPPSLSLSVPPQVMISKSPSEEIIDMSVRPPSSSGTQTAIALLKSQTMVASTEVLEQDSPLVSVDVATLDKQIQLKRQELVQIEQSIIEAKEAKKQELKVYQQAVQQLQDKRAPQIETTQPVIKASNVVSVPSQYPWSHGSKRAISVLGEHSQVIQRLKDVCKQRAMPFSAALSVHSTLLAGGIPVLAGENAFDILETYASCVVGGRVLWLPIAPTMLEPTDVIGRPDTTAKKFLPHAAGLADLLLEAKRQPDDLYLVVLDGINRAAIEYYLQPSLTFYHEQWQRERVRSFPLFHSSAVVESDPYAELAQMHWTRNILITATLSDGMAVIPPPASFWNNAALINPIIGRANPQEKNRPDVPLSKYSAISASTWLMTHERLKKRAMMVSLEDTDVLTVVENKKESLFSKMLYQALCEYLEDKKKAADTVTVQVEMPRALATDMDGTLMRTLGKELQGMKQMIKQIEQFVR